MARPSGKDSAALIVQAGRCIGKNQRQLADLLGVSRRTVARWTARQSSPSRSDYQELAKHAYEHDREFAATLAQAGGTSVDRLGLVPVAIDALPTAPAAPSPSPPPPPPIAPALLVECVVCAAATAMNVPPNAVRPALAAAFQRAREARLSVEAVDDVLGTSPRT